MTKRPGFWISLALLCIATYLVCQAIYFYYFDFSDAVPFWINLYFTFLTSAIYFLITRFAEGNGRMFVAVFVASSFFKLMLSAAVLLIALLLYREKAISIIVLFNMSYFIYTAFETSFLYRYFRGKA